MAKQKILSVKRLGARSRIVFECGHSDTAEGYPKIGSKAECTICIINSGKFATKILTQTDVDLVLPPRPELVKFTIQLTEALRDRIRRDAKEKGVTSGVYARRLLEMHYMIKDE